MAIASQVATVLVLLRILKLILLYAVFYEMSFLTPYTQIYLPFMPMSFGLIFPSFRALIDMLNSHDGNYWKSCQVGTAFMKLNYVRIARH